MIKVGDIFYTCDGRDAEFYQVIRVMNKTVLADVLKQDWAGTEGNGRRGIIWPEPDWGFKRNVTGRIHPSGQLVFEHRVAYKWDGQPIKY